MSTSTHSKNYEIILTANKRLAAHLTDQQNQTQRTSGEKAWALPSIFSINHWLKQLWLENTEDLRVLLTPYKEYSVWKKIISSFTQNHFIVQDELILMISEAYHTLIQWNLPISRLRDYTHYETVHFLILCIKAFENLCAERNCIPECKIMSILMDQDFFSQKKLPEKITFVGFLEPSLQLTCFIKKLQTYCPVYQVPFMHLPQSANVYQCAFLDLRAEVEQIAYWAKSKLENTTDATIGCVFINLASIRELVKETFTRILGKSALFNLSLGKKLSEYPIIRSGRLVLSFLANGSIQLDQLGSFLYSPFFIASFEEMVARSELSAQLIGMGINSIKLDDLIFLLSQSNRNFHSPQLAYALQKLNEQFKFLKNQRQSPTKWASCFIDQLKCLGWPGSRSLNSEEYQTVERFIEGLQEFSQLTSFNWQITMIEAFNMFSELLEMSLFQAESKQKSRIQVMGLLEASGILFDCLWVSGLDNEHFPARVRLNPFIPAFLQKKHAMPYANAENELARSREFLKRFSQSTSHLLLSYTRLNKDVSVSASFLIKDVQEISLIELNHSIASNEKNDCVELETLLELKGPPIRTDEQVKGGSTILKYQAACAFRAFAALRLGIKPSLKPTLGLSQFDKGNLIHTILEKFWKTVQTHQQLVLMHDTQVKNVLQHLIKEALQTLTEERPWLLESLMLETERERLIKLMIDWLQFEKKRSPFKVVALEKGVNANLCQIPLSVKIDRIDALENNQTVLIDYKTGKVGSKPWEGNRPNEPQLPLYWLVTEEPIHAIAFAQVHAEEIKFKGVSQYEACLPGVDSVNTFFKNMPEVTWHDLKAYWKGVIEQLLNDFREGDVKINPKKEKETCDTCGFQMLCRVHEHT